MTSPTLARDADGRVALSTEQATALALALATLDFDPATGLRMAIIHDGDNPDRALARWVLRCAPVVAAAEAQADAWDIAFAAEGDDADGPLAINDCAWQAAADATETAVKAARGEKAK